MAADRIVFAMANPDPEAPPELAASHCRIFATGRSDYPNQINNALAFPGIFRGALDVQARDINEAMKLAAASLAGHSPCGSQRRHTFRACSTRDRTAVAKAVASAARETAWPAATKSATLCVTLTLTALSDGSSRNRAGPRETGARAVTEGRYLKHSYRRAQAHLPGRGPASGASPPRLRGRDPCMIVAEERIPHGILLRLCVCSRSAHNMRVDPHESAVSTAFWHAPGLLHAPLAGSEKSASFQNNAEVRLGRSKANLRSTDLDLSLSACLHSFSEA